MATLKELTDDSPHSTGFTAWLGGHRPASTAICELARDVATDPDWPDTDDVVALLAHLEELGAIDAAVDTQRRAHLLYGRWALVGGTA
ncbi:hypothetical protein [Streptomyces sp. NPDC057336]|uniref:hypothetical protein n=1 Tax=Streptomyces sp. NPDC057336 TaxID=3346102 RepID=UPI0036284617